MPAPSARELVVEPIRVPDTALVRGIAERAAVADAVEPLGEQPLRALSAEAGPDVVHFVARYGPTVVGYAQLAGPSATPSAELVVDPASRRAGVGSALLAAVLARAPQAAVWAHGELPAARALANSHGLQRVRQLLIMSAELHPDAPADTMAQDLPPGVELGTLAEAAASGGVRWPGMDTRAELLRVNNAAFAWHPEQGGWTADELDARLAAEWVDPAGVLLSVATDPGGSRPSWLAGFHWTKIHRDGTGAAPRGEVYVVAVDPAASGQRLGRVLTAAGMQLLAAAGCPEVFLYVEGDNSPALRTYQALGFQVSGCDVAYASPPAASPR